MSDLSTATITTEPLGGADDRTAVRELVFLAILLSLEARASEVRFEPLADGYRLSYVVDGVTYPLVPPPRHLAPWIARELRALSGPSGFQRRPAEDLRRWAAALDRRWTPAQGARFRVRTGEHTTEVVASSRQTPHGEAVVLHVTPWADADPARESPSVLRALRLARQAREGGDRPEEDRPRPRRWMATVPSLAPPPAETIEGASADLRGRRRSCAEVLGSCLARIDEWEPRVRAWVLVDRDGARAQAKALDEEIAVGRWRGPLHGIPIGVKDIIDVAGLPTACGARRWADRIAAEDAPIVARLRAAGAVIVGKAVTTPYAWIDPPPTRNPWNSGRTPGGSSSGSAAALACGMVLGALGTQTGGSITRPAAFCGVAGLKPTYRALATEGILPLAPSLDHPGPLARTVADLERLWEALAGRDPSPPLPDDRPIRLGRLRGLFDERAEPVLRDALDRALAVLAGAGFAIAEAPLPAGFDDVPRRHRMIMAAEAAAVHRDRLAEAPDDYPPRIRALIEEGLAVPVADYIRARQHRSEAMRAELDPLFERFGALVTPAALGPAPDASTTGDPLFNSPWSYAGLPTVTFPIGLTPDGLPLGIQLIGPRGAEPALLRLARGAEAALGGAGAGPG